MLVRIKTEEARIGMFLHAVDGGWLASPFWRSQFVLTRTSEIRKLIESGIDEIVIDVSKGVGVGVASAPPVTEARAAETPPSAGEADTVTRAAAPVVRAIRTPSRRRVPPDVARAQAVVERSKTVIAAMFSEVRLGKAVEMDTILPLVDQITESVTRDTGAMLNVTRLKTKNEYTYVHSVAVGALLVHFAQHMRMSDTEVRDLALAGLLHDIGKMAVPNELLDKAGRLAPDEFDLIRLHPENGHALLRACAPMPEVVLDVCLHHHERVDGRGYPFGLSGDQLSLAARMSAICDVYDAVTSQRPYKRAWSPSDALARMRSWRGHFDQELLGHFIESIGIHPVGDLVRLRSSRLALVIEGNDADPTAPRVRAFYDIPTRHTVPHQDMFATAATDPIYRSERGELWFGAEWPDVEAAVRAGTAPSTETRPVRASSLQVRG
ncbi:HD-GYP domain-containing protein [Sphingomonas endophytica]|uniref:HD-GYP domain-containing protein n=1 Tax=Sphingomonas endophytica TaxID=869719 RepID=A0A147I9L1_9SPHN|nr:HD-GYP domain-containing protein [Sphingomonas endophytica]KTT76161.1 hypothetical protein NS334_01805 [Sphingomonas endophytica]